MLSNAHANHINFNSLSIDEVPNNFWDEGLDGDHYLESGVCDNDSKETKDRNVAIAEIREKYLASRKVGNAYYEQQSQYTYKSLEDYKKFLQEIEDKGLDIKAEPRTPYEDKLDVLYYKPEEKLGRDPATGEDPDIYYSFKDLNKCQKEKLEDEL
jgi:hypothetical protein